MNIRWLSFLLIAVVLAVIGLPRGATQQPVTVETLRQLVAAFNAHDLDAVMSFFAEDCELFMPRGPEPWGRRYVGKAEVRNGLATRFEGLPDVHYGDDEHWVSGNHAVSRSTLTGTTKDGKKITVRGCDLLEFRAGKIVRKDSYWKILEPKS
ncbi:MAG: nuclear transport factor 2 family protein [Acidobacteria bacterium]|nr:MAG: nuclear transport factor 2 family protein [Acidobacteriota bacterium]